MLGMVTMRMILLVSCLESCFSTRRQGIRPH